MTRPVLSIEDLTIRFGDLAVVEDLSLTIRAGETLALVGESGCGKSVTALSLLGLLPPAARVAGGKAVFDGHDLTRADERAMNRLRGASVSMVFQEPVLSLDPTMRVGRQVAEALRQHRKMNATTALQQTRAMFQAVGIPEPDARMRQYPHELSGGMCQRVMIAMALICRPRLLIADEPTTALDVTIQAQILDLIGRLRQETGTAVLLITHDMGVVAETADRVAVMYAGRIVETAPVATLFRQQRHPYTHLLLRTIPRVGGPRKIPLPAITGSVPDLSHWQGGCRFHPRCPLADARCRAQTPPLVAAPDAPDHRAACWHSDRLATHAESLA